MAVTRPSRGHTPHAARAEAAHRRLARAAGWAVAVRLWNGRELGPMDAPYRLVLHHPGAVRALVPPGSHRAAAEAYARGLIDIDGDIVSALGDLARLHTIGWKERARLARAVAAFPRLDLGPAGARVRVSGVPIGWGPDVPALRQHRDSPPDFCAAFLGRDLIASSGYYLHDDEPLASAQVRELDLVCRKLRLQPGMRLLDVDAGWGALLAHAARNYGVTGVGLSPSRSQVEEGDRRLREAGLDAHVELRLADRADLDERFDAVVSLGTVEHAGRAGLFWHFRRLRGLLEPGGLVLAHSVVAGEARRGGAATYLSARVLPHGGPVPAWRAVREVQRAGFGLLDVEQLRSHYALTLRAWVGNLEAHWSAAAEAGGEEAARAARAHIAGAASDFEAGQLGMMRLVAGREARVPLARALRLPRLAVAPRPASAG